MSTSRGSGPSGAAAVAPGWSTAAAMSTFTWKPTDSSSGTTTAPDASPSRACGDDVGDLGLLHVDERLAHVELGPVARRHR